ncbi:MAG: hypothetical protein ACREQI_09275 [Candidatus Binataceae bacterium]
MNYKLVKASVTLMLAGLFGFGLLNMSACDPCHSCGGGPTPTHTHRPTPTPTPAANACLPSSSIGVLVQTTNVTAYVPQGNWEGGNDAIAVVPIETSGGIGAGGSPTTVVTGNVPNSCSANSNTGTTVCVANNTDVYLINGSTLTSTLTSGATNSESFSGGGCENCGVVVDSSTNRALITVGLNTIGTDRNPPVTDLGGPGGYQYLDLGGTPAFETPIGAGTDVSEDVTIDPARQLILSPNEDSNYQIVNVSGSTPAIFNNALTDPIGSGELDSAAEDCTTGIAIATDEETGQLYLADLTQASFTAGTPGTWSSPGSQFEEFPEFDSLNAGTCGAAVAPGTHLAIVTGEFGGNLEGVVELPSTSGSGTPTAVDYVAFTMPDEPDDVGPFNMGHDPHTVTSYVSPNNHNAYAVLGDGYFRYLGIVDMQGLLSAPRTPVTPPAISHTVAEPISNNAACTGAGAPFSCCTGVGTGTGCLVTYIAEPTPTPTP